MMIGGPIEVRTLLPETAAGSPLAQLEHAFASARGAIEALIGSARSRSKGRYLLAPEYFCFDSLGPVFARSGLELRLLPVDDRLTPDPGVWEEIAQAADRDGGVAAIVMVDYFGLREMDDAGAALRRAAPRAKLILDRVQAMFSLLGQGRPEWCDVAVYGLRKALPVSDGCLLVPDTAVRPTAPAPESAAAKHVGAAVVRGLAVQGGEIDHAVFLDAFDEAKAAIDTAGPAHMSAISKAVARRFDLEEAARRRRANFIALRNALPDAPGVEMLSTRWTDTAQAPGFMLVKLDARIRDAVRAGLASQAIYCPVHWPVQGMNAVSDRAAGLSRTLLSLPVDHRYGDSHMMRLAGSLKHAINTATPVR